MFFFFFNDTATTEIYPLSLHDALPISASFARISGVPRVPISPAVKSRIPVLYPRCAIFSSVPPQVSSTSSGWAEMDKRSRFITPQLDVDSISSTHNVGERDGVSESGGRQTWFAGTGTIRSCTP